jgi:hypothetical protein
VYNEGGVEKLREVNFYRPQSELMEFKTSIETYFKEHPPASIKEAIDKIEEITGLKRSKTQVRKFLTEQLGFKWRKVGVVPANPTFAIKKKISLYQGFWATVTTDIPKVLLRLNFFLYSSVISF